MDFSPKFIVKSFLIFCEFSDNIVIPMIHLFLIVGFLSPLIVLFQRPQRLNFNTILDGWTIIVFISAIFVMIVKTLITFKHMTTVIFAVMVSTKIFYFT